MRTSKALMCLVALLFFGQAFAQNTSDAAQQEVVQPQQGAPVVLERDTLFQIYSPVGSFSKEERAAAISRRVKELVSDKHYAEDSVKVMDHMLATDVTYLDRIIVSITDADAAAVGEPREALAEQYAARIRTAVTKEIGRASCRERVCEAV